MGTINRPFPATTASYRPRTPVNPQANPSLAPTPPSLLAPPDPMALVARLGLQTQTQLDGRVLYNEPLAQSLANCREAAISPLKTLFQSASATLPMVEGLYAAEKMAELNVKGLEQLYPALARWNSHPDPMIQMHLARFYRKINEPKTFGPMLSTAVNYAVNMYPMSSSASYNVTEEVGATLLEQIATRTARETVRQLLPFLQPKAQQPVLPPFPKQ